MNGKGEIRIKEEKSRLPVDVRGSKSSLMCKKETPIRRVKTELQMATVFSLWSFDVCSSHLNLIVKLTCLNVNKQTTVFFTCTVKPESVDAINHAI